MREGDDDAFVTTSVSIKTDAFSCSETRNTNFLIEAISTGDACAVRRLIDAGQDPNMSADWYKYACVPPLALALQQRHFGIARALINSGADVLFGFDEADGISSAMSSAIVLGGEEAIQLLLDAGHPVTRGMLMQAVRASRPIPFPQAQHIFTSPTHLRCARDARHSAWRSPDRTRKERDWWNRDVLATENQRTTGMHAVHNGEWHPKFVLGRRAPTCAYDTDNTATFD